jgi:RNA-binding protein
MGIDLTGEQRRRLRSAARSRRPDVNVGKAGLARSVVEHAAGALSRRALVKGRLLDAAGEDRADAASQLAETTGAELVDLVGRAVVLYRPNPDLPDEKRIRLG